MKVKDVLNTLTTEDKVAIYERRQEDAGVCIGVLFEGKNGFDIGLEESVLQREVKMLTVCENRLFIDVDGDEDET